MGRRFWLDQLLSSKSLLAAGAAAVGLIGWATTHHPAFGWLMLGGSGAWTALMYYVAGHADGDASLAPRRAAEVREVERSLKALTPPRGRAQRAEWRRRAEQLRRIVALERIVFHELPRTTSGVAMLSPEQQLAIAEIVDQAIDLAKRRPLLLRALEANPRAPAEAELRTLIGRRPASRGRVARELDELIALKREHVARIARWEEDLHLVEISLDQIETFLQAVAYDHAVTPANVSEQIGRVKTRVAARRESVEELERRINQAAG